MRLADYVINLVLSGVLIVGSYQFYFWCQRNAPFEAREFASSIDDLIPYVPRWVWVYSFLYYPAILYVNLDALRALPRIRPALRCAVKQLSQHAYLGRDAHRPSPV